MSFNKQSFSFFWIYLITLILAACSILYELMIAHTISILAGHMVVWYSLTIGIYLAFLGFGSILYNKIIKGKHEWEALFRVEILLTICGCLSVMLIHVGHMLYGYYAVSNEIKIGLYNLFAIFFLVTSVVGFLSGIELPLLIKIGNEMSQGKRVTNRILGTDYIGSLLGAVSFPIIFVPFYGVIKTSFIVAGFNLLTAIIILFIVLKENELFYRRIVTGGFISILFIVIVFNVNGIEQYFLKKYYFYQEISENLHSLFLKHEKFPDIKRTRSFYQKIDLVEYPEDIYDKIYEHYSKKYSQEPDLPRGYLLFLEGDYQLYSNHEDLYHEFFAHVPIMLNEKIPEEVLVLGAGDGILIKELLNHSEIKKITHVELDEEMIRLANNHPILLKLNRESLKNQRVESVIDDAFHYVRKSNKKYDAVYIDFPLAMNYNLSKLYSKEFYQIVSQMLKTDGYIVLDTPGSAVFTMPDKYGQQVMNRKYSDWPIYYNTVKAAGFRTIVPYVSNLEINNHEAESYLWKNIEIKIENMDYPGLEETPSDISDTEKIRKVKANVIKKLIREFVLMKQQGFIFLKRKAEKLQPKYKDFNIDFSVLNEKRFKLAFTLPYSSSKKIDYSKVNSIMQPTLPNLPFLYARLPI